MSKILFINSSPNKSGNTAKVAAALLQGREYETLNLTEYKIYGYGQQFPDDQFSDVVTKIKEADTVVFGSPLYWHNISGLMRAFMDHCYGMVDEGEFRAGPQRIHLSSPHLDQPQREAPHLLGEGDPAGLSTARLHKEIYDA